jgi:TPR repeat protein
MLIRSELSPMILLKVEFMDIWRIAMLPMAMLAMVSCDKHQGVEVNLNNLDAPDSREQKIDRPIAERDDELDRALRDAESGLPDDLYNVAKIYAQRVKENKATPEQVLQWCEKAARLGHAEAQMTLAGMYYYGIEIPRNLDSAKYWFEQALNGGNYQAAYYLGLMEINGEGVAKTPEHGVALLEDAATHQVAKAMSALGRLFDQGGESIPQDKEKSLMWLEKAARHGESDSAEYLGKKYYQGIGVPKDSSKAYQWYSLAAGQGAPHAQYITGLMLLEGEGVKKDLTKGVNWLKMSAGQDHIDAMGILAVCYSSGIGVTADPEIARVWKERALRLQQERSKKNNNK